MYAACWRAEPALDAGHACMLLVAGHLGVAPAAAVAASACETVGAVLAANASSAPSLRGLHLVLSLAQHLSGVVRAPRVLVITCGTAIGAGATADAASHGGAWGFARVRRQAA